MKYDAFISYAHASDSKLAASIQHTLMQIARPWYRRRALAVFRDATSLAAATDLTAAIRMALSGSGSFIYLGSPAAAKSPWVGEEISLWRNLGHADRFLIVLTEGAIVWDPAVGDFDWSKSTALHPKLKGMFSKEPLWVDLRWARSDESPSSRDPRFLRAVAMLAAPIHGLPLEDLIGEDVRQFRRTRRLVAVVMVTLVVLVGLSATATFVASEINTSLRSKLRLVETALPFFNLTENYIFYEDGAPSAQPPWTRAWRYLMSGLQLGQPSEIWVDWEPPRFALRAACEAEVDSVLNRAEGAVDPCPPPSQSAFDDAGLRADIPGLKPMLNALVSAFKSGRALQLLVANQQFESETRLSLGGGGDGSEEDLAQEASAELQLLSEHLRVLLPKDVWQSLPKEARAEEEQLDAEDFMQGDFQIWRSTLPTPGERAEILLLRINSDQYCGTAGCTHLPVMGFMRVGEAYELILVQFITGSVALHYGAPHQMPQVFLIELTQSGMANQYRKTLRMVFDRECVCYRPYLTGRIVATELVVDQRMPATLP